MDPPHADYPPDFPPQVATGPYLTYHDDFTNGLAAPDTMGPLQVVLMVFGAVLVFVGMCWRYSTVQRAWRACWRVCCCCGDDGAGGGAGGSGGDDGGPILPFYGDRVHEKRDRRREEEMGYAKQDW